MARRPLLAASLAAGESSRTAPSAELALQVADLRRPAPTRATRAEALELSLEDVAPPLRMASCALERLKELDLEHQDLMRLREWSDGPKDVTELKERGMVGVHGRGLLIGMA